MAKNSGLTMIEIAVVIGLFAILISLGLLMGFGVILLILIAILQNGRDNLLMISKKGVEF